MSNIRKAQMWDKMQYLFRNYYDRMIHVSAEMDGTIDVESFSRAAGILVHKIEILRCKFCPSAINPYWLLTQNYNINDYITVIKSENISTELDKALTKCIPFDSEFQIRFTIVNGNNKCGYAILLNHMCADGSDTKYLIGKLIELYADIVNGGDGSKVKIKQGTRENRQLYDRMPAEKVKVAKRLYKNISQSKIKVTFPFTPTDGSESIQIFRLTIDGDFFEKLTAKRKSLSVTVNDIFLTAFFRTLYTYLGGKESSLNIISMMDLRRYCGGETLGVTNMTGFAPCQITMASESFNATLDKVKLQMEKSKKDEYMGLYGLPLLKLAFTVFPYALSELAIKIGYQNPLIGMSNIGIMDRSNFQLSGTKMTKGFMTGASKYKPYMQLTTVTFENTVNLAIAEKCNEKDAIILKQFLVDYKKELLRFCESN